MAYWVIPPAADAEFAAHMEQVLDAYAKPYDAACPVLCMDEQPVQLTRETRRPIPATAGHPRRVDFCHTPKCGSWLNVAENELSSMTWQCLKDRRIGDLDTLRNEIAAWSIDVNQTQRGVDWQMKIDDARCKLKSIYPNIEL